MKYIDNIVLFSFKFTLKQNVLDEEEKRSKKNEVDMES